ncbi:MAG: hypothetical protein V4858_09035 [Pseudomonadota bacterium]
MQPVSCTRIIGNKHNLVRAAVITATAQRPSTQLLQLSQQRTGNGRMVLSGPYTGAADSEIDVEVLSGSAGALRASTPVVNGVGNGTLEVQSIDAGAAAQTLRFTLLDAGTAPQPALLDFFGVQLAARAVGVDGNDASLSVVRSLSYTDLPFATLEKMSAGSNLFDGPQFDWGQPAATGADIPEGALRMAFAGLPTVHRAWKTWDSGRFVYRLDPPLAYDVPEDTRIRQVSGDYELTLSDGTTDEVYTAITMYDFLAQVQARSALIQVLGVVAQDRAPGGQAVTDIPLRTDAHALPVIASAVRNGATLQVGDVDPGAATQNITVTCLGRSGTAASGGQSWSVSGGVVGTLPAATSGQLYTDGPVQFTIQQPAVAVALNASITARFLPTSRDAGEGLPAICFKPLLLGTAATNKEVTFEYKQRPPDECSCSTATALKVSMQCLGLAPDGGADMDAEYQSRLITLYNWQAGFIASNVALLGADQADIDTAVGCTGILGEALAEIYDVPAAATAWDGVFDQLVDELAPFANLAPGALVSGGLGGMGEGPAAQAWTPRAFALGGTYLNPVNNHRYTIDSIEINGEAVSVTPVDATLPAADVAAAWLTDGTSFSVTEVTDVVLTVTDMGLVRVWGDFEVGRTYEVVNPAVNAAGIVEVVRVLEILVAGVSAALPAGPITWNADRFSSVGALTGTHDASSDTVSVSSVRLAPRVAGATVAVGEEIINSLNHHGYRVDVIEVGGVSTTSASARLPGDGLALWLTDGTDFDVTMPSAARASLVLTVTDAELTLGAVLAGATFTAPFRSATVAAPFVRKTFVFDDPNAPVSITAELNKFNAAENDREREYNAATGAASSAADIENYRARFTAAMAYFQQKYAAKMDWVRAIAGIPPKASAGSAGSPCWRDYGDSHWWEDTDGFYLPAFTGKPFVSATRNADGSIVSTQEFGFGLITQCGHRIKEGDRFTIRISGTNGQNTWSEGDRFVIPLIGAASAPLTGGADGDPTQTWTVRSSVLGALADYPWLASAPAPWAHAPATVQLSPGGIPFEVGDSMLFDIEGGGLRWRRDGGSWNEEDLYGAAPLDLGDGLLLQAQPGAAPSFLGGDTWQFSAVATYGTQRMRQPRIGQAFAWNGAAVTVDIDLLTAQPLEAVMLAMHGIALDATVVISGGLLDADEWTLPADVYPSIILAVLPHVDGDPVPEARYLRVAITGAGTGGSIGWLWAGMGWQPTVGPSTMEMKRQYGLARGAGINPAALYRGVGTGGQWSWNVDEGAALLAGNARALRDLVDHSAAQGLEPLALIPDLRITEDASIALIDADEIVMREFNNWQDQGSRVVSVELPLRAVLA